MARANQRKVLLVWLWLFAALEEGGANVGYCTSTCVKSFGLVESRLDVAFPLGLDARWQYNWKSIRSTTLFGCCVSIGVRCKMSPSLEDKLWSVSSTPLFGARASVEHL